MRIRGWLFVAVVVIAAATIVVVGVHRWAADDPTATSRSARPVVTASRGRVPTIPATGVGCSGVPVPSGSDIQLAIDASPGRTTFCLAAGTYRVSTPIRPRTGDRLIGAGRSATVLDGSVPVTGWTRDGDRWWATARLPRQKPADEHCARAGCSITQDVFVDDRPLERTTRLADLTPDRFYEDFARNRIYLGRDPLPHDVEQALARSIVQSSAGNVYLEHLSVQKAANAAQVGGVHAADGASGWVLDDLEISGNHGTGAIVDGGLVLDSDIHHNGQLGLAGAGDRSLIAGNRIHDNNVAGYDAIWEAGGAKFGARATNMTVTGNEVYDNHGPGLWCDIDCFNWTVDGNTVTGNTDPGGRSGNGVLYEISYVCSIHHNTVSDNGPRLRSDSFFLGAQILISASSGCTVHDNRVSGGNGIGALQQHTDSGEGGPWQVRDLTVRNNEITISSASDQMAAGLVQDIGDDSYFTSKGNRWVGNTYRLPDASDPVFDWSNRSLTQKEWVRAGQS